MGRNVLLFENSKKDQITPPYCAGLQDYVLHFSLSLNLTIGVPDRHGKYFQIGICSGSGKSANSLCRKSANILLLNKVSLILALTAFTYS